jgi:hypothetical protein
MRLDSYVNDPAHGYAMPSGDVARKTDEAMARTARGECGFCGRPLDEDGFCGREDC